MAKYKQPSSALDKIKILTGESVDRDDVTKEIYADLTKNIKQDAAAILKTLKKYKGFDEFKESLRSVEKNGIPYEIFGILLTNIIKNNADIINVMNKTIEQTPDVSKKPKQQQELYNGILSISKLYYETTILRYTDDVVQNKELIDIAAKYNRSNIIRYTNALSEYFNTNNNGNMLAKDNKYFKYFNEGLKEETNNIAFIQDHINKTKIIDYRSQIEQEYQGPESKKDIFLKPSFNNTQVTNNNATKESRISSNNQKPKLQNDIPVIDSLDRFDPENIKPKTQGNEAGFMTKKQIKYMDDHQKQKYHYTWMIKDQKIAETIIEKLTSDLMSFYLKDQPERVTPKINLIKASHLDKDGKQNTVLLASRMIENFITGNIFLYENNFQISSTNRNDIKSESFKEYFNTVPNAYTIYAVNIFLGNIDAHLSNAGVIVDKQGLIQAAMVDFARSMNFTSGYSSIPSEVPKDQPFGMADTLRLLHRGHYNMNSFLFTHDEFLNSLEKFADNSLKNKDELKHVINSSLKHIEEATKDLNAKQKKEIEQQLKAIDKDVTLNNLAKKVFEKTIKRAEDTKEFIIDVKFQRAVFRGEENEIREIIKQNPDILNKKIKWLNFETDTTKENPVTTLPNADLKKKPVATKTLAVDYVYPQCTVKEYIELTEKIFGEDLSASLQAITSPKSSNNKTKNTEKQPIITKIAPDHSIEDLSAILDTAVIEKDLNTTSKNKKDQSDNKDKPTDKISLPSEEATKTLAENLHNEVSRELFEKKQSNVAKLEESKGKSQIGK